MTSNLSAFYKVIQRHNDKAKREHIIDLGEVLANSSAKEEDLEEAARYLIACLEKTDPEFWLDFEVFKGLDRNAAGYGPEWRAEVLLTCGGPYAAIQIDSRASDITFSFRSGRAHIEARIDCEHYGDSAGAAFKNAVQSYAEAY